MISFRCMGQRREPAVCSTQVEQCRRERERERGKKSVWVFGCLLGWCEKLPPHHCLFVKLRFRRNNAVFVLGLDAETREFLSEFFRFRESILLHPSGDPLACLLEILGIKAVLGY